MFLKNVKSRYGAGKECFREGQESGCPEIQSGAGCLIDFCFQCGAAYPAEKQNKHETEKAVDENRNGGGDDGRQNFKKRDCPENPEFSCSQKPC